MSFLDVWLATPQWWFSPSQQDDEYITRTFSNLLDSAQFVSKLEMLVVFDQLPHHIYRKEHAKHIITYFLQKALSVHFTDEEMSNMTTSQWVFAMLPKRHSLVVESIFEVMSHAWMRINDDSLTPFDKRLLRRFIKASYTRCPVQKQFNKMVLYQANYTCLTSITKYKFCNVYKTVDKWLSKFLVKNDAVILSLSGGVDSMVLGVITKMLGYRLISVMINYENRQTANDEEKFVSDWCKFKLGVPLFVRQIHEIKRDKCMKYELRELYETYTRNVRYACYKDVWKTITETKEVPKVLLGHNMDDCFENVLTNVVQQKKFHNLKGMTESCEIDGICFIRPMLSISKKEIREFALRNNIPHLPDSTVSWCQRGIIRDKVRPTLENWDCRTVESFFSLGNKISEFTDALHTLIKSWISKVSLDTSLKTWTLPVDSWDHIPMSQVFWRGFLHELTGIHISKKSLDDFTQRLQHRPTKLNVPVHKLFSVKLISGKNDMIVRIQMQDGI